MTRLCLIILTLLTIAFNATGQKAKDIIELHAAAVKKTMDEKVFHSFQVQGDYCHDSKVCFDVVAWAQYNAGVRLEMSFQKMKFIMVFTDSLKWEHNPFEDTDEVSRMKKGEQEGKSAFEYVSKELIDYKKNGAVVRLVETTMLDSLETYMVEYKKDDVEKIYYINTKTYLINKAIVGDKTRLFLNYAESDGIYFPLIILEDSPEQKMEMRFKECLFNVAISDSMFVIPPDILDEFYTNEKNPVKSELERVMERVRDLYNEGHLDSTLTYCNLALKINPRSDEAYNYRGLAKLGQGKYYDAISDFTRALEINTSYATAHNNIGYAKYSLGDFDGAIADYNKALTLDSGMAVAYSNRGLAQYSAERYEEAFQDFSVAARKEPNDATHFYNLGVTLAQLGKDEEAINNYRKAIGIDELSAASYNRKGVSEYRLEKFDSARVSFERALSIDSTSFLFRQNLGNTLYNLGLYDEAIIELSRCLKLENDDEIHNMIGLCHFRKEDYDLAVKDFTRAIEVNSKNAIYFDNRAMTKRNLDDFVGAIQDYDQSIKIYPNDPETFYNRGMAKILSSKKYEGCLDLATANEMNYEPAKQAIMENCH